MTALMDRAAIEDDLADYRKQKYRETGRYIESAMSDAMYRMAMENQNFKDSMKQMFLEIAQSFARMIADMIAKEIIRTTIRIRVIFFESFSCILLPNPNYP